MDFNYFKRSAGGGGGGKGNGNLVSPRTKRFLNRDFLFFIKDLSFRIILRGREVSRSIARKGSPINLEIEACCLFAIIKPTHVTCTRLIIPARSIACEQDLRAWFNYAIVIY